ncbi:MAG TPA: EscU/YscU/HrcU family type III secretion system export apparatus switch protein [Acidobacteriaceae bacterium]|nr:EscU/YscU/HrcU family type III secretion system export apparatus switch protein [Acidobacteriaceae bacterium]
MPESDKTQKATPHRRKKAREQGQLARSREFGSVVAVLGAAITFCALSGDMAAHWSRFYEGLLVAASDSDFSASGPVLFWSSVEVLRWIVPVLLVAMLLSVGVTLAQGGLNFAPAALRLRFERLSGSSRMSEMFSFATLNNLAKSLLPFIAIAILGISTIQAHWSELTRASGEDIRTLILRVGALIGSLGWKAALVLFVWASVDYVLTWRQAEGRLRMSHDEVRREHKENDGNPFTKGRIRKRQRTMRQRKPLQAAATATLVVTNPTHFAVALRYEHSMQVPEVVAKGCDLLAQRIKSIAQDNNVPVMESKPLARALYATVEVGQAIPSELYQAVAEILVVVFRAQAELREREAMRRARNAAGEAIRQI